MWAISTTDSWINFDHSMVGLLSLEYGIPQLHYATPAALYSGFSQPAVFPDRRSSPTSGFPGWRFCPAGRNLGAVGASEQRKPCRANGSNRGPGDSPSCPLVARRPTIGRLVAQLPIIDGLPRPRVRAPSGCKAARWRRLLLPNRGIWYIVYHSGRTPNTEPCLAGMATPRKLHVQTFDKAPISILRVAASSMRNHEIARNRGNGYCQ